MSLGNASQGIDFLPAYQISALPYIVRLVHGDFDSVSNVAKVSFPYVTSWLFFRSSSITSSSNAEVSFIETGIANNKTFIIDTQYHNENPLNHTDPTLKVRCKEIWIKKPAGSPSSGATADEALIEIMAGLTTIPSHLFYSDITAIYS